jgi:hypothetical protein
VATAGVFAALYAVLGAVPISRLLLGQGYFLTASNFISPLAGMLFGPIGGGLTAFVGDLLDTYVGHVSFAGTGPSVVAADLAVVLTSGLAFAHRRTLALAFPVAVLLLYSLDPLSVQLVGPVPFAWLDIVSLVVFAPALLLEAKGKLSTLSPVFVVSATFAALMCGQFTGTLVGQNLAVRVYGLLSAQEWRAVALSFFPLYPVERIFFTAVGALVSLPVLRAVARRRRSADAELLH